MTTTAPGTTRTPYLPELCPGWCDARHHPGEFPEDRAHSAADREVPLSTERAVVMDKESDEWHVDFLALGLRQHVREIEPRVLLYRFHDSTREASYLTLDEAERLADALRAAVVQGRGQVDR